MRRHTISITPRSVSQLFLAAGFWVLMACGLLAQGYRLQPGDALHAEITRLSNAQWTSMIGPDGFVRFPYIGRHYAAGKTLEELQESIGFELVGTRISFFNGAEETVLVLDGESLFLDIAEYRPVTVLGAVAQPGRVEYRPGLTVRAVIGIGGGIRIALDETIRPERVALLNARVAELQSTQAWLALELWSVQGQLDPELAQSPPDPVARMLTQRLGKRALADTRTRIADAQNETARNIQDFTDRIALTTDRIGYLNQALEQYEIVSRGEEERLASLLELRERGLTTDTTISTARSGALSASSRLLLTEADLYEARRELASLSEKKAAVKTDLRQTLLADQARLQRRLDEVSAQLKGARQELAMTTGQQLDDSGDVVTTPQVMLHRQSAQGVSSAEVGMDDPVLPGDVIEVLLQTLDPSL